MGKFKNGDLVKCIDVSGLHVPRLQHTYQVRDTQGQFIKLLGFPDCVWLLENRFEPAPPIMDRKPEKITKHALLDLAKQATADRGLSYGKPEDNFARIARRWSAYLSERAGLKIELNAADVSLMMIDMKLARLEHKPDHLDSWIDVSGYAACGANITCDEPGEK